MCWCVMSTSSMSSTRRPWAASAVSSSSRALPEFGPVSTSVSGSSSMRYVLTRPTANGVGIGRRWIPAAAATASSGTDDAEHLVAPGLHVLARDERFEAQAQQGLGVGRPYVEVPVVEVDAHPVDVADRRAVGRSVAVLELGDLRGGVRDLGVDLARDEVLRAVGLEQLAHRLALDRQLLE